MKEPHQNTVGSREKSVRPSTSPEPAPTRAIPKDTSSRGSHGGVASAAATRARS
jgi:hypothetical protein